MSVWRTKTYRLYRKTKTRAIHFVTAAVLVTSTLSSALPLFVSSRAFAANGFTPAISFAQNSTAIACGGSADIANGAVTVKWTTISDSSSHSKYKIILSNAPGTTYDNTSSSDIPAGTMTGSALNFGSAGVGAYVYKVEVYKSNGNLGDSATCTLNYQVVTPPTPTIAACTNYGNVLTTDLATWDLSETRPKGHNELVSGGLHIWTDSNDSESKAAAYYATNFSLTALGTETIAQSIDYTPSSGITPGLQLVTDFDNDGTADGILVGEAIYGNNWWLSTGAAQFVKSGAPHTGGGNGSDWFGTASEWLVAFPSAKVKAIGYSLGSGVLADGVLTRITLGCVNYTFNAPTPVNHAPSVPILAAPANGTVRPTDSTPPITNQSSWNASTDPDGDSITYIYQSASDGAFTSVLYTSVPLSNTLILNPDEPEITYYWRVKAVDSHGAESAWSDVWVITIDNTAPAVPVHLSPADNTLQNFNDFYFDWTSVAGAVEYEFQAATSPSVDGNGSLTTGVWNNKASGAPDRDFLSDSTIHSYGANGTWYWQVRAIDAANNKSAWTNPWKVTIDMAGPTAPAITSPTAEQYFTSTPILNKWDASSDASGIAKYQVAYRYDDGHTFGGSTCDGVLIGGLPLSGCRDVTSGTQRSHVPGAGEQGGVTIWVRALDNAGNWSDWSTPVHYYYDADAPSTPTGGQPHLTFLNSNIFNYTWGASTDNLSGPITYEYQASQNPAESGGVLTTGLWQNWISGNASQNPLTSPLIPSVGTSDGIWYWQVRAVDTAGNRSAWSAIWHYTLDSQAPIVQITSFGQSGNAIQPTVTASDPAPGTALSYLWDDTNAGVTVSNVNALNPTFTVTIDGTYTFHLTVTDEAGNSTTVPFTFTYTTPEEETNPPLPNDFTNVTTTTGTPPTITPPLADNGTNAAQPEVLGDSTTNPDSDVEGASTVKLDNVAATDKGGNFLGLGWWWLLVIGGFLLLWLLLAAGRRRKDEQ